MNIYAVTMWECGFEYLKSRRFDHSGNKNFAMSAVTSPSGGTLGAILTLGAEMTSRVAYDALPIFRALLSAEIQVDLLSFQISTNYHHHSDSSGIRNYDGGAMQCAWGLQHSNSRLVIDRSRGYSRCRQRKVVRTHGYSPACFSDTGSTRTAVHSPAAGVNDIVGTICLNDCSTAGLSPHRLSVLIVRNLNDREIWKQGSMNHYDILIRKPSACECKSVGQVLDGFMGTT